MRKQSILSAITFIACGLLLSFATVQRAEADKLDNGDCEKCHNVVVQQVQEAGNKHKSEVSCMECHDGQHPPGTEKGALIPQCANCHDGEPHFDLADCASCHSNPHQPLNIVLSGEGQKAACNTCHPAVIQEIDTNQSKHTGFACSFCHEKHRYRPDCLDCHDAHAEGQTFENCVTCHQVHQPLTLAYTKTVVNSDCGACHGEVKDMLEAGPTKHAKFQCVFCHADTHGNVPECQACHETPHSAQMLSKFKTCNECHQSAHDILK